MKTYKMISLAVLLTLTAQLFATVYPDSVMEASKAQYRIRQGLNIDIAGGAGLSGFAFRPFSAQADHVSNAFALPVWNGSLGISYYFLDWLGVGTGVQFSTYANTSKVDKPWKYSDVDAYGDGYNFTATPGGITEKQGLYMIEVPLALRFRAIERNVGFHGLAGIKFGMPVKDFYTMTPTDAVIHNVVEYPTLGLTLNDNMPGVLEDATISGPKEGKINSLNKVNYGAYAEVGMLFRLHQRLDLLLALAATYYINDMTKAGKDSRTALGFSESAKPSSYDLPYAQAAFDGVINSKEVESLHPWSVMVKLGLSINTGRTTAQHAYDDPAWGAREAAREAKREAKRRKAPVVEEPAPVVEPAPIVEPEPVAEPEPVVEEPAPAVEPEPVAEPEPIIEPEPIAEPEPVVLPQTKKVPEGLQKNRRVEIVPLDNNLFPKQIVWFQLNDVAPILEPADLLERIAEVLVRNPEQKVQVNGHACTIGKFAYNKKLSLRRANVIAQQLRDLGVRDEQLIIQSFGSEVPYKE